MLLDGTKSVPWIFSSSFFRASKCRCWCKGIPCQGWKLVIWGDFGWIKSWGNAGTSGWGTQYLCAYFQGQACLEMCPCQVKLLWKSVSKYNLRSKAHLQFDRQRNPSSWEICAPEFLSPNNWRFRFFYQDFVDLVAFPRFANITWLHGEIEAGDILFIPHTYWHQACWHQLPAEVGGRGLFFHFPYMAADGLEVNSKGRNLAVNIWSLWLHLFDTDLFASCFWETEFAGKPFEHTFKQFQKQPMKITCTHTHTHTLFLKRLCVFTYSWIDIYLCIAYTFTISL